MLPRCIKCLTTLMPEATACPNCGRPAPPKSALTQQQDIDKTQFVQIAPGDLLPENNLPENNLPENNLPDDDLFDDELPPLSAASAKRRILALAVLLGLLAGAFLLLVIVSLTRARH